MSHAMRATKPGIDLNLHRRQMTAFTSKATEILYGGAAGGGKSHLMRVAAIAWCCAIPGLQVYLFRRTYPELLDNHINGSGSFLILLAPAIAAKRVRLNLSKLEIEFSNGSKIHLCHCQNENDVLKYQGAEIHVLMVDELTHFTAYQFRFLRGRMRIGSLRIPPQYAGQFPRAILGSNPGGIGHNWVKAAFVDNAPEGEIRQMPPSEGGMKRQFIRAKLADNPTLAENDPEYANRLMGLGEDALVKAMLDGDWDIVAGGMFDDVFKRDLHILEPFAIPSSWYVDRSFDWGSSKPFSVCWWAESDGTTAPNGRTYPPGTLFLINEWYGSNGQPNEGCKMLASEIAEGIEEREAEMGIEVAPGPADSSIFDSENGNCIAEDMAGRGIYWTQADKSPGSRKAGWEKMRNRFKAANQFPMEDPGLFFFNNCLQAIRTIPVLPRDQKKTDDVDTSSEDHCFTGDTLVETDRGPIAIRELAGKTGLVVSSDGRPHAFENCRLTRRNADVVRVQFNDGRVVFCTPDHRFLHSSGEFQPVSKLIGESVWGISGSLSSAKPCRNFEESDFISAGNISSATGSDSMSRYGKPQMVGGRKVSTFITSTTTAAITSYPIWKPSQEPNTDDTIWRAELNKAANSAIESDRWPQLGTAQRREKHGIGFTMMKSGISFTPERKRPAFTVEKASRASRITAFARTIANRLGDGLRVWITSLGSVSRVAATSPSTSTGQTRPVLDPAARLCSIVSVEPAGKADVYCLSVPDTLNFTIEGGIVVHNCGDAVRYRVHTPNVGHAY